MIEKASNPNQFHEQLLSFIHTVRKKIEQNLIKRPKKLLFRKNLQWQINAT